MSCDSDFYLGGASLSEYHLMTYVFNTVSQMQNHSWWMSVKERYVSFYREHAAELLLPKNETDVMGEALFRLSEEKDDAMETAVNRQNTMLGINNSFVKEQMKKCMQMDAGLTTEVFEIRKTFVVNYNKAFLGEYNHCLLIPPSGYKSACNGNWWK